MIREIFFSLFDTVFYAVRHVNLKAKYKVNHNFKVYIDGLKKVKFSDNEKMNNEVYILITH